MNLQKFLRAVDAAMADMPREQLMAFIHQQARMLSPGGRPRFLDDLTQGLFADDSLEDQVSIDGTSQLFEKLQEIQDGTIYISSAINERYDDWYDNGEEEFLFEDPQNIAGLIEESIREVHTWVEAGAYEESWQLCQTLFALSVTVEGEFAEYMEDSLSLQELVDYELLKNGSSLMKQLYLDALATAFHVHTAQQRCEAMFHLFAESGESITLEQVLMATRRELPGVQDFLPQWVDYLSKQNGSLSDRLIKEAVLLSDRHEIQLETARREANTHPGLYLQILQKSSPGWDDTELLQLGLEALSNIHPSILLRSSIALLSAECALRLDRREEAEKCWVEAFRSNPSVTNELRLVVESRDFGMYEPIVREIVSGYLPRQEDKGERSYLSTDQGENRKTPFSQFTKFGLAFLDRDFDLVLDQGMKVNSGVGWSSGFVKAGLALFLLYFYEGYKLEQGTSALCGYAASVLSFDPAEYQEGLLGDSSEDRATCFWRLFRCWRDRQSMSEEEASRILSRLEQMIELRVEGIMAGNHRKTYWECAMYVAAMGEVKQSRGERRGKERFMENYRAKYSRRIAFHRELRAYGMN